MVFVDVKHHVYLLTSDDLAGSLSQISIPYQPRSLGSVDVKKQ